MAKRIDLTGQKFNRWTIISLAKTDTIKVYWHCLCSCGKYKNVLSGSLRTGRSKSCGCLQKEVVTKHGKSKSIEYSSWLSMKDRCNNPNNTRYKYYGGRGITVCKQWLESFQSFLDNMGTRPSIDYTIDRIENNKNYTPDNCQWITRQEQNQNTSRNKFLTYKGQTKNISQWAKHLKMSKNTLTWRLISGWSTEKALETPVRRF